MTIDSWLDFLVGPAPLSDQFDRALRLAAVGHRDQERRSSRVPHVAYPVAVAWIVERAGFAEPTVIAALPHDLVEDTPTTLDEIRDQFGPEVAATVAGCSEVKTDAIGRTRDWEDRKRDHLAQLPTATVATRAVVLADKPHNLMSIRLDLARGVAVWESFHAPRDRVLWYFAAVIETCGADDPRLVELGRACWAELERLIALGSEKSADD